MFNLRNLENNIWKKESQSDKNILKDETKDEITDSYNSSTDYNDLSTNERTKQDCINKRLKLLGLDNYDYEKEMDHINECIKKLREMKYSTNNENLPTNKKSKIIELIRPYIITEKDEDLEKNYIKNEEIHDESYNLRKKIKSITEFLSPKSNKYVSSDLELHYVKDLNKITVYEKGVEVFNNDDDFTSNYVKGSWEDEVNQLYDVLFNEKTSE